MRTLLIHADKVSYEVTKKTNLAEEIEEEMKSGEMENVLFVRIAVEQRDEKNPEEVAKKAVDDIEDVCSQIDTKNILLYPYVHLLFGSEPGKPKIAIKILKLMEEELKEKGYNVKRAPFGYYKKFTLFAKGHPLAELSREIKPGAAPKIDVKRKKEQKPAPAGEEKELAPNDHRILGRQLDLYSFHEYAPGMAFWHANGMVIRNELMDFWRREHVKAGYHEINTPQIMNQRVWETSGHWEHYKENMFFTSLEDQDFALKPMNCPGAILVFKSATRSYRELPLRLAELGIVHRNELSGVLSGLFRLRAFTQDDAHIFVMPEQLEAEILRVVDLVAHFYKRFGFDYHVELSTRPENAMGSKQVWDIAERALEDALKSRKMNYKLNPGEGAFYGPKIDFHLKDSLGRTWQCATVQVDFQMPERFDCNYVGEDNRPHRPVIIHRVIYGAIERFVGILVEHYNGAFPAWLAPVQVRVISFADRNIDAVNRIVRERQEAGIRADSDLRSATVDYKVRESETQKIPYAVVIGDKEENSGTLAVRKRGAKPAFGISMDEFLEQIKREIAEMK